MHSSWSILLATACACATPNYRTVAPAPTVTATATTGPSGEPITVPPAEAAKMLEKATPPVYPPEALRRKLDGKVVLQVTLGPDGKIIDVKALQTSDVIFVDPAIAAVRDWQYKPFYFKGSPVIANLRVTVNFRHKK